MGNPHIKCDNAAKLMSDALKVMTDKTRDHDLLIPLLHRKSENYFGMKIPGCFDNVFTKGKGKEVQEEAIDAYEELNKAREILYKLDSQYKDILMQQCKLGLGKCFDNIVEHILKDFMKKGNSSCLKLFAQPITDAKCALLMNPLITPPVGPIFLTCQQMTLAGLMPHLHHFGEFLREISDHAEQ